MQKKLFTVPIDYGKALKKLTEPPPANTEEFENGTREAEDFENRMNNEAEKQLDEKWNS